MAPTTPAPLRRLAGLHKDSTAVYRAGEGQDKRLRGAAIIARASILMLAGKWARYRVRVFKARSTRRRAPVKEAGGYSRLHSLRRASGDLTRRWSVASIAPGTYPGSEAPLPPTWAPRRACKSRKRFRPATTAPAH